MINLIVSLSVTLSRTTGKVRLVVVDTDCDANACVGLSPYTLDYPDGSYQPGAACTQAFVMGILDAGTYAIQAVQYNGAAAKLSIPLPVPVVATPVVVPPLTAKFTTNVTTAGSEWVSVEIGAGAFAACSLFNVYLYEASAAGQAVTKQFYKNTDIGTTPLIATFKASSIQVMTNAGGTMRPTVTNAAQATAFMQLFAKFGTVGISCEVITTGRKYQMYNTIPGTPTNPIADTYIAQTTQAGMTAYYATDTFLANMNAITYATATAFFPGEIIELVIKCDSVPTGTIYTSDKLALIPTADEVTTGDLNLFRQVLQSANPSLVLALINAAPVSRKCTAVANKLGDAVLAATDFTTLTVPPKMNYDKTTRRLQLTVTATGPTPICNGRFRMTFGQQPMVVHRELFATVPALGKVFDLANMYQLSGGAEYAITNFAQFETTLKNDRVYGYLCSGALGNVYSSVIVDTTIVTNIGTADDYVTPGVPVLYDRATFRVKLTAAAVTPTISTSCTKFRFTFGSNPRLLHGQQMTTAPAVGKSFDVASMMVLNGGQVYPITDAIRVDLQNRLQFDQTYGFVCVSDLNTIVGATASLFMIEDNVLTAADDYIVATWPVKYDKAKYRIQLGAVAASPVCSGKFRFTFGSNPMLVHIQQFTTIPVTTKTFDVANMMVLTAGVEIMVSTTVRSALVTTLVVDQTYGFICVETPAVITGVTVATYELVPDNSIAADDYAAPTLLVSYDQTTFNMKLNQVAVPPSCGTKKFRFTFGSNPTLVHSQEFSALPDVVKTFNVANMNVLTTGVESLVTPTVKRFLVTTLLVDKTFGFVCVGALGAPMSAQPAVFSLTDNKITTADDYAVYYDKTKYRIQITPAAIAPVCPGKFRFTFGLNPRIIHLQEFSAMPVTAKVFDTANMMVLTAGVESVLPLASKLALITTLIVDQTYGFVCVGALQTILGATPFIPTVVENMLLIPDDYMVPVQYDKTTFKVKLSYDPSPPSCTGKFQLTFGLNPMLVHIQQFSSIPTSAKVFDVANMNVLRAGGQYQLALTTKLALVTTLAVDQQYGFICVETPGTVVSAVSAVFPVVSGVILGADDLGPLTVGTAVAATPGWAIALIVILLVLLVGGLFVVWFFKIRKSSRKATEAPATMMTNYTQGNDVTNV